METKAAGVIVGPAEHEDCEQMARLEFASFAADDTSIIGPLMFPLDVPDKVKEQRVQTTAQGLQKTLEAGKRKLITAKIDDNIVGWAEWVPSGQDSFDVPDVDGFMKRFISQVSATRARYVEGTRYWYLALIVVDHAVWKRGIGRKLVQWGLDEAQKESLGPADAFLEASLMGEPFYWRLGFETLGWDKLEEKKAPGGVCKWPFMIKRG